MRGFTINDISQEDMCEIVQSWLEEKFAGDGERAPRAKYVGADGDGGSFSIRLSFKDDEEDPNPASAAPILSLSDEVEFRSPDKGQEGWKPDSRGSCA